MSLLTRAAIRAAVISLVSACLLSAQQREQRMTTASNVNCREQPNPAAPVLQTLRVGERFTPAESQTADGGAWHRVSNCWVSESMTTVFSSADPGAALLTAAERAFARERATFAELAAVEDLFGEEPFSSATASSARLQLWRLRILDRAAGRVGRPQSPSGWITSRQTFLTQSPFSRVWRVPPKVFWDLYTKHQGTPEADEIAWTATQAPIFGDECYTDCILDRIARTTMQYWSRLPQGRYIPDAVARASKDAEYAGRYCAVSTRAGAVIDFDRTRALTTQLRSSLGTINTAGKDELLGYLSEIERTCSPEARLDLTDSRSIPGLIRSLGSGFSLVSKSLAAFGDAAAPGVLGVARSDKPDPNVVQDALRTLKLMIEATPRRISTRTIDDIGRVAEERLRGRQDFGVLIATMDLAVAIGDPALKKAVENLAASPNEARARGIEDSESIGYLQKAATRALAGR